MYRQWRIYIFFFLICDVIRKFPSSDSSAPLYLLSQATPSNSMCNIDTVLHRDMSYTTDYKKLYKDLLKQCHILKTENQKLLEKTKKKNMPESWSRDEVAKSFGLIYYSKRAYMYVRDELHYPLPGLLSFQRWAKTIDMSDGLISDVLKIMKLNSDNIEDHEKLTVLMFDEVKVCRREYDEPNDKIVGPHSKMLVVMAQGIASKWKQPIYVDFDVKMSKIILFDIIDELEKIGYKVICCVTNCDDANVKLWNQLEITYENPTFCIPNGRRIVYIPDSHHLLKLARNWLLDTGFYLNGAEINKIPLEALITKISSEVSPCHKLKREHLKCEVPLQQNIKLAKQLLSYSTATALQHYRPIEDFELLNNTAEFIKQINNWFDLANVSLTNDNSTPFKSPYGTFLYQQDKLLNEMYNTIIFMRCMGKNSLQIFQKGFLMHINGTKQILHILKENGLNYLLTSKINKDALQNLFDQIYSGENFPSPLNALSRLRMIFLGKYPGIASNKSNTRDNNHEEFIVAQSLKLANISLDDEYDVVDEDSEGSYTDTTSEDEFQIRNEDKNKNEMEVEAVEYLAGWLALKYKSTIPEIGYKSKNLTHQKFTMPSWINHLSYSKLIIPSDDLKKIILRVERLFNKFTKYQVLKGSNVVAKLTNKIFSRMSVEKKFKPVIQTYIKQRIIIRMKYLNYHIRLLKQKNKSKN
ncbi:uncharacterized protein LOC107884708 isoform X2 [Acyrthosiphon pisum]|uniref:Transposable element P transposase n=1 Tax=Acyrthosiphon pisum TaxID=7029 RepID=A0A8R2H906_ACYPI|nr:uncharacterized protein LOC107884708 isoform X2 [Acyrthosiphon pisum]|eukprot:XP_016662906.1 PREDICTED: uncharacterized protein LOC107884708 isoform X2 [Acyrthosiphon pisum]